jgi:transcriptional repressor NrdR
MHCLNCGSDNLQVIYTRKSEKDNSISRRRICNDCGLRFTTLELIKPKKKKQNDKHYHDLVTEAGIFRVFDVYCSNDIAS